MGKKRGTMRRRRRFHRSRIRRSLKASNWGPILAILGVILGIAASVCLLVFVVMPWLLPLFGINFSISLGPAPTPAPTPEPTPEPHPMESYDPAGAQQELVFSEYTSYKWFGDPYFYNGKMLISGGKLVNGKAVLGTLLLYDPDKREAEVLPYPLKNSHYMFAKFNDRYLVYLDANMDGGGYITMVDLSLEDPHPVIIKEVYTGQPEIMLDGDYIAWTDRTGSRMDKLFVCDLRTLESTTLVMFQNSVYGQSLPSMRNGLLSWADAGVGDKSLLYQMRLSQSTASTYDPGTYIHDPESDGTYSVWLDSHHEEGCNLYYTKGKGTPIKIATDVVEFGLGDGFVAYSRASAIYVYFFETNKSYRLNPNHESAIFLGVSDGYVIWMDVTSRERDIVKYVKLPV